MQMGNTRKRKRPVYVVCLPTGVIVGGEEAQILVGVRLTAAGAETLKNVNKGAIVKKSFLIDE